MTLGTAMKQIMDKFGQIIKINYYDLSFDEVYDDQQYLTYSGCVYTSGAIVPLDKGTNDFVLVEQGLLQTDDMKIYTSGNTLIRGSGNPVKIQLGSPTGDAYTLLDLGTNLWTKNNNSVYKKSYIRRLTNGSMLGEI